MIQTTTGVKPYQTAFGNFLIQSHIIDYKMNFKKILFYPLPKLGFKKITKLLITSSHYSV